MKGNKPLTKHDYIEIVKTTRYILVGRLKTCCKVYIVEDVALICQSPIENRSVLHEIVRNIL